MKKKIIVEFKSKPIYFEKERDGLKQNTIREIDIGDKRFKELIDKKATHIRVTNTETKESFERKISDVTIWKDDFMIISWNNSQEPHYWVEDDIIARNDSQKSHNR